MNLSDLEGEPSCKRQENGDASIGTERPLKKARFAWQVKGKYHLKNEKSDSDKLAVMPPSEPDKSGSSSENESDSSELLGNAEQNLEILGDYLLKQDFNTLDSVIADSEKSLLKPCTSIRYGNTREKLDYPRYLSSTSQSGNNSMSRSSASSESNMSIPMSMVVSQIYSEDQCIARWQARQMAKGFVDNTINRVLDSWMMSPLRADLENNRFLALDVAEFINNLPGQDSIENEGILMAISAHGLQNNSSSSSSNDIDSERISNKDNLFLSAPSSPLMSEEGTLNSTTKEDKAVESPLHSQLDMSWSQELNSSVNSNMSSAYFPDTSSSSYQCFSDPDHYPNIDYERDQNVNSDGNELLTSHYDFMDAAVSFAIQNKGLTSFGTDYG